jgi:AcrR family transcriptional regulator
MTSNSNDVRAEILSWATRLFARHGYEGASLATIAAAVGIRKASLLYHFPSKEALRTAVLERVVLHWNESLPQLLGNVTSGRARFDALVRSLVDFFNEDPDRARLVVRELLDRPVEMREQLRASVRPWIELLADYIRRGQAEGRLRPDVRPDAYVMHIITLALSSIAARPVLATLVDEPAALDDELFRIADVSLFAVRAESALHESEDDDVRDATARAAGGTE